MRIEESFLQEVIQRILSVTTPQKIILFGSAATDRMTTDSDIDLLVVKSSVADNRQERREIRASLEGLGKAFDVFVMESERFEESKSVIGGLAYPANRHGRVVYEAA
ncbi:MAG: nucleotidyltransferase domain-containing protein [Acidobacteria bacterium]|nr:nucleotidyltransferase domain-containing protein [Acidobacteriota bacterium]